MKRLKCNIGVIALVAITPTLHADIVWSGEQNINLSWSSNTVPSWPPDPIPVALELDLNADGIKDFTIGETDQLHTSWFYAKSFGSNKNTGGWIGDSGSIVDDSRTDWTGGEFLLVSWMVLLGEQEMAGVGPWAGETGYMGVQFDSDDGTHFGWVHMTVYAEHPGMTIHSWAYESVPGEGIIAGAIPEPSSGLLTIVGAISVWFLRKRNARFYRIKRER